VQDWSGSRNILASLRFDGTAYHGWQVQPNGVTVQSVFQDALASVTGARPPVSGCSRTDAGVHAREFFCNFHTFSRLDCTHLRRALNTRLPGDVRVTSCREVPGPFHARYSAVGKEYVYSIWNSDASDPFLGRYTWFCPRQLDIGLMREGAQPLLGRHDFSAMCSAGGGAQDKERTVSLIDIARCGSLVTVAVRADGFLYNMVRIIAGTLAAVSLGRLTPDRVEKIMESGTRCAAAKTLPANGLCLTRVFYDRDEYRNAPVTRAGFFGY
jgi:tRNA pseudouridine38-40 synthase